MAGSMAGSKRNLRHPYLGFPEACHAVAWVRLKSDCDLRWCVTQRGQGRREQRPRKRRESIPSQIDWEDFWK